METTTLARPLPIRHKNEPCCAPAAPPRLSHAQTEALADRLKALADPTRLRMLDLLAQQDQPLCVCDITDQFPQNQRHPLLSSRCQWDVLPYRVSLPSPAGCARL
jgi:hypothetical protein